MKNIYKLKDELADYMNFVIEKIDNNNVSAEEFCIIKDKASELLSRIKEEYVKGAKGYPFIEEAAIELIIKACDDQLESMVN